MIVNKTPNCLQPSCSEPSFIKPHFNESTACQMQAFRDRSAEFDDIIRFISDRRINVNHHNQHNDAINQPIETEQPSQFEITSNKISHNLYQTSHKVEKLNLLTKRSFAMESRRNDIEHLIDVIRQDTTNLNSAIMTLQKISVSANDGYFVNKSKLAHSKAIIVGLQAELARLTSSFKSILEIRNTTEKERDERRRKLGGAVRSSSDQELIMAKDSFLARQDRMQRLRLSQMTSDSQSFNNSTSPHTETAVDINKMQSLQLSKDNSLMLERSSEMRNVEETIVQLGEVFQQLAVMVHEQGEMVQRIDANIEEAHFNLESATFELKKYFRSISSNRWLIIKVFAVLFIFLIIFVVFFL